MTKDDMQRIANLLVKAYRREIVRDGDWWFGTDDYDFNIHDCADQERTGYYIVNVYEYKGQGITDYTHWVDLEPVYIG
jgi:hypothetical protein